MTEYAGLGGLGMPELLVIVGIGVLLFGGKKIPELAKGIGTAFKELKSGLREAADVEREVKKP